jgi:hypothetical protein
MKDTSDVDERGLKTRSFPVGHSRDPIWETSSLYSHRAHYSYSEIEILKDALTDVLRQRCTKLTSRVKDNTVD